MSSENVDAVRPIYAEWGRGNFFPTFDVYDPEMEWGWSDEFPGLAHVWKLRDGKVVRLEVFADRARALESVGVQDG